VARRIEIELTSARPDGTWTWRAAGALNPRGTLDASLLYDAAKAGDVVRAEAEFGIDGITVVSVEPPRPPEGADPNRIQLIDRPAAAGVTTQLAGGRGRPAPDGGGDRRRGDQSGPNRGRSPQRTGPGGPPHTQTNGNGRAGRASDGETGTGQPQSTPRPDRQGRPDRPPRPARATAGPGRGGPRGTGQRETHGGREGQRAADGHLESGQGHQKRAPADRERQKRLSPGNAHRNAMLESLPPEQRPIAQQLLRGGIPAVRTALHFERERAREEGRPEPSTEGVLALAESLVSRVKAAEWRDRADAAIKLGDDLAMRDLRSLVSGSDAARDEASRELVVTLREMLERRVEEHRTAWSADVTKNLDEGHVVRALRISSRPPDPAARFSAELATRLRDAASAAMSPGTPEPQWLALLQAVVESPVRRTVRPEGLPANPSTELLDTARQQCGRVPALAPLLGISVPPPPGPVRPVAPTKAPARGHGRPSRPGRQVGTPAARASGRPRPVPGEPAAGESAAPEAEPVSSAQELSPEISEAPEVLEAPEVSEPADRPEAPEVLEAADRPEAAEDESASDVTRPEQSEPAIAEGLGTVEAGGLAETEVPAAEYDERGPEAQEAPTRDGEPTDSGASGTDEALPPAEVTSAAGALRAGEP
jgi:hypothetical protein